MSEPASNAEWRSGFFWGIVGGVIVGAVGTLLAQGVTWWVSEAWHASDMRAKIPREIRHRMSQISDDLVKDDPNAAIKILNGFTPQDCLYGEFKGVTLIALLDLFEEANGPMTAQQAKDKQFTFDVINDPVRNDPKRRSYQSACLKRLIKKLNAWFPE
jgi:hypothetical protein